MVQELAYKPTDANATESAVYQQYQNLVFTFLGVSPRRAIVWLPLLIASQLCVHRSHQAFPTFLSIFLPFHPRLTNPSLCPILSHMHCLIRCRPCLPNSLFAAQPTPSPHQGSVDDTRVFRQNRDSAVSRCNEEVIQQEAQREFEDITASVLECLAVITSEIFGPAYALDADGSLDSNGMEDLWELAVRGESNTTVLSNAYTNATTGAAPGGQVRKQNARGRL